MIGAPPDMRGVRVAAGRARAVDPVARRFALVCPGMNISRSPDALPPPEENTRVALVTGAAGSIGAAIASDLTQHRVRVVLSDRPTSALEPVAVSCGGKAYCLYLPCELSGETACQGVTECAGMDLGRLDVLVNNAGTWFGEPFLAEPGERWWAVLEINAVASARLVRRATPLLERDDYLTVVHVASENAFQAETSLASYNAFKTSPVALTRTMALGPSALPTRANAVAPATMDASSDQRLSADLTEPDRLRQRIPLGKFGPSPEEMQADSFLCGECGSCTTGETLLIGGGGQHAGV
jgi:2-hydroxycyclohexanecarboxyl-CoA dehydrogenase